ncbi:MAG: TlpA family protein disulfide reductase, partial [Bacteroidaceae bacterium]|nr:TlpA family protein disulfide reductase [Bacteroidaceae bacterium]
YMLTTADSIQLVREETEEDYIYKLSIYEDQQVEFFGRDYKTPKSPFSLGEEDEYSFYTLWIHKADAMPYRYLREMSHQVQDITCRLTSWSDKPAKEPIIATDYIPKEGYEVHYVGKEEQKKEGIPFEEQLVGKPAPGWTLKDIDGKEISLKSLRGKPTIINITGLGCGPCALSYPELVEMSKRFNVVSIEAWGNKVQSLIDYVEHHKITYPFLPDNEDVLNAYVDGNRGVPVYFYLDNNHIIQKVDRGYKLGMIGQSVNSLGWE